MSQVDDVAVLIPAAGAGERVGLGPKAFLELDGATLLERVVRTALRVSPRVSAAVPADRLDEARRLCPGCTCMAGGASRQESVALLVRSCDAPWIVIQDVARPFASERLMRAVVAAAREVGTAGAFLSPDVPVARIDAEGMVLESFDAAEVGVFQAPQAFSRSVLLEALERAEREGWRTQSTLQLTRRAGFRTRAVPGERTNLKITTPEDWRMAVHVAGRCT